MTSYHEQIENFLHSKLSSSGTFLKSDTVLITSGYLDSLQVIELIEFVEGLTGKTFSEEEMIPDNFDTFEAILKTIEAKRQEAK